MSFDHEPWIIQRIHDIKDMVDEHIASLKKESKIEFIGNEDDMEHKFNFLIEHEKELFQGCSSKSRAEQRLRLIGYTQSYDML